MARTLAEVNEALSSVRHAINAAQLAQETASGLGNKKIMANLDVLYRREDQLLDERTRLESCGVSAGLIRNSGVIRR